MEDIRLTPMMKQYQQAKSEIPEDAILLFRMGDFYEMFFEDATRTSAILDITLTKRAGVPMCGFPYHALESHLPRLIESGVKSAIAEQMEDPRFAKGIVKRQITRIITPGTIIDSSVLQPGRNNFLVALIEKKTLSGWPVSTSAPGNSKLLKYRPGKSWRPSSAGWAPGSALSRPHCWNSGKRRKRSHIRPTNCCGLRWKTGFSLMTAPKNC